MSSASKTWQLSLHKVQVIVEKQILSKNTQVRHSISHIRTSIINNIHQDEEMFLTSFCWRYIQICLTVSMSNFLLSSNTAVTIVVLSLGPPLLGLLAWSFLLFSAPLTTHHVSVHGSHGSVSVSFWCSGVVLSGAPTSPGGT